MAATKNLNELHRRFGVHIKMPEKPKKLVKVSSLSKVSAEEKKVAFVDWINFQLMKTLMWDTNFASMRKKMLSLGLSMMALFCVS